jgi:DNA-binding NarL/FixJ family response regulator
MQQLLETASAVRCVLFLAHGGEVQWMPPNQLAPMLSWLPEHATADEIECALRSLIACARAGVCATVPVAIPVAVDIRGSSGVPAYIREARLLRLTLRQYEVLVLLSRGLSVKSISRQLRISVPTVKSHTLQLYRRLMARNKSEAVFMARERGAALATVSSDP